MYLVTANEMREMDRLTIESFGLPGRLLMENAGRGATRFFLECFPECGSRRVGVVAGRGNNGGDGFVMARYLAESGIPVTVFLLARKAEVRGDAEANLELLAPLDIPVVEMPDPDSFSRHLPSLNHQAIWIDAILGTGLKSEVKPYFGEVISFINASGKPVFCVDIPSGLDADTGQVCGVCVQGSATATFGFAKIGHMVHPGAALTGALKVVDIGIPGLMANRVGPKQHLTTPREARKGLVNRRPDAHKGRTGHLLVVGGSPGKTGAAAMAAVSALRVGAGLVTTAIPRNLNPALETLTLEAMTFPLPDQGLGILSHAAMAPLREQLAGKKCVAIGPGLGTHTDTRDLLFELLTAIEVPMVLDADALNCLASRPGLLTRLKAPVVLTPHPGEMARLAGTDTRTVQQDRITSAREFAGTFHCHVVLKGPGTVIARPDGTVFLNPTGNAGMAAGGMGDVLTGLIAGLITQGATMERACRTGVYLHGAAADTLAAEKGPYGYLAGEVMHRIPEEIRRLTTPPESLTGNTFANEHIDRQI
jgi:NAD(P)H-hydrate epimerase